MKKRSRVQGPREISGSLVGIDGARGTLDGFLTRGPGRRRILTVFVPGMGSNFHSGRLKKELLRRAPSAGFDCLSVNNSGFGTRTAREKFRWCLADLDGVVAFARRRKYKGVVLMGHSTGCQKVTYYQAVRRSSCVRALVLAAPVDDYAAVKKELGRRFSSTVRFARRLADRGDESTLLPAQAPRFTARRFLSFADASQIEARIFNYKGPMRHFGRVSCPVLALVAGEEEYACIPAEQTCRILRDRSRTGVFDCKIIKGADHGFHGREGRTAGMIYRWLKERDL
ncbi:MAG: alpha/beta fold hydrolase [Kiritimatiellia bacterium]